MLGANGCQALLVAETLTPHPPDCFVHGDQLFQQRRLLLSAWQTHVLADVSLPAYQMPETVGADAHCPAVNHRRRMPRTHSET